MLKSRHRSPWRPGRGISSSRGWSSIDAATQHVEAAEAAGFLTGAHRQQGTTRQHVRGHGSGGTASTQLGFVLHSMTIPGPEDSSPDQRAGPKGLKQTGVAGQ